MTSDTEGGGASRPPLRILIEELTRSTEKGLGHQEIRDGLLEQGVPMSSMPHVSKRITDLVNDGILKKLGKPPHTIYIWVPPEERVPRDPESAAERLVQGLDNPTLRAQAKAILDERKRRRAGIILINMMEKNRIAEERQAEKDSEMLEGALSQRLRYWEAFVVAMDRFDEKLAKYVLEYDQLPTPTMIQARVIDEGMAELRRHLQYLEAKLWPGRVQGKGGIMTGSVIDVDSQ